MIKKVAIIANPNKKKAVKVQKELKEFFKKKKIAVVTDKEVPRSEIVKDVDLIITLGGDGTLLNIAKYVNKNVKVLGVNFGSFGFLTEVKYDEVIFALKDILNGNYSLDTRMMLKTEIYRGGKVVESFTALNDVVINKGSLSRILTLSMAVDGETVATYLCDGLILATSTGSTAHSLSAGGPIVSKDLDVVIVTPICPHTLTNRPLVLSSDKKIKVKLKGKESNNVALTADGQVSFKLKAGDEIMVKKAAVDLKLITSKKRSYFQILREKLKWGNLR